MEASEEMAKGFAGISLLVSQVSTTSPPPINSAISESRPASDPDIGTAVRVFAARMASGESMRLPEDLQFYQNNSQSIEAELASLIERDSKANKKEELTPVECPSNWNWAVRGPLKTVGMLVFVAFVASLVMFLRSERPVIDSGYRKSEHNDSFNVTSPASNLGSSQTEYNKRASTSAQPLLSNPQTTPIPSNGLETDNLDALTDKLFYSKHPELNGRVLQPQDDSLRAEWLILRHSNELTDFIFYRLHAELHGRKLVATDTELAKEWKRISKEVKSLSATADSVITSKRQNVEATTFVPEPKAISAQETSVKSPKQSPSIEASGDRNLKLERLAKKIDDGKQSCKEREVDLKSVHDKLDGMKASLDTYARQIRAYEAIVEAGSPVDQVGYQDTLDKHNALVSDYNTLLGKAKSLYTEYESELSRTNRLVDDYNRSIGVDSTKTVPPVEVPSTQATQVAETSPVHSKVNPELGTNISLGMSRQKVLEALGEPNSKSIENGFEKWLYGEAYVEFYGDRVFSSSVLRRDSTADARFAKGVQSSKASSDSKKVDPRPFRRIAGGMSEEKVQRILGEPTRKSSENGFEKWEYGESYIEFYGGRVFSTYIH